MAEIRQAEYQDRNGNIYHFHTDSEIVKYKDTTVKEYLDSLEKNNIGSPIIEATGTNNYIGSSARITSMSKGTKCTLFIENDSTGNCTLNINGLGIKNIKDSNGNIVTNMKANTPYNLCYNGQDFILQGKGGGGNLIAKYLLSGYYGEGDNGRVNGTMVNRGAPTTSLNCGGTYNISEGYYSGGKVIANSLASQMTNNGVTLTSANQILSGVKAISNTGQLLTGSATIESLGGRHFASGTFTGGFSSMQCDFKATFVIFIEDNKKNALYYYNGKTYWALYSSGASTNSPNCKITVTDTGFSYSSFGSSSAWRNFFASSKTYTWFAIG